MIKICQRCGKEYPPASNRQKYCADCRPAVTQEYNRQYYLRNSEEIIARVAQYKENNRDTYDAYQREYSKKYRAEHKDTIRQYKKQWLANNPDKERVYCERAKERYHKKRRLKKLEAKKLRLIAKMQANAAKRQTKQIRRKELYQGDSFWDNNLNAFAQRM